MRSSIETLLKPINRFTVPFFFLTFLLWFTGNLSSSLKVFIANQLYNFSNIFFVAGFVYILLSVACFLEHFKSSKTKWIYKVYLIILHVLAYSVFFVEFFLRLIVGCRINPTIFELIYETNTTETMDFIGTYILSSKFTFVLLVVCMILLWQILFTKIYTGGGKTI